jgi:hypothetical protein
VSNTSAADAQRGHAPQSVRLVTAHVRTARARSEPAGSRDRHADSMVCSASSSGSSSTQPASAKLCAYGAGVVCASSPHSIIATSTAITAPTPALDAPARSAMRSSIAGVVNAHVVILSGRESAPNASTRDGARPVAVSAPDAFGGRMDTALASAPQAGRDIHSAGTHSGQSCDVDDNPGLAVAVLCAAQPTLHDTECERSGVPVQRQRALPHGQYRGSETLALGVAGAWKHGAARGQAEAEHSRGADALSWDQLPVAARAPISPVRHRGRRPPSGEGGCAAPEARAPLWLTPRAVR